MDMPILSQMEKRISRLSLKEQLWLMERLVQQIKENTAYHQRNELEDDRAAMANGPEIRTELREIEKEFAFAESDGLDMRI